MSKFFEALSRDLAGRSHAANPAIPAPLGVEVPKPRIATAWERSRPAEKIVPDVVPRSTVAPSVLARHEKIRRIVETVGAVAAAEGGVRVLVTECAPGDGSSIIAEALVLDLTQRLGLRTLLVDGGPRRSSGLVGFNEPGAAEQGADPDLALPIRPTKWERLEMISVKPALNQLEPEKIRARLNDCMQGFPVSIVDLGAVRSEPRLLSLLRKGDSVLVVARAGITRRSDLNATINVFGNLHSGVAAIILQGYVSAVPLMLRRILERKES